MMEQISMEWWIDMFGLVISLGVLLLAVRAIWLSRTGRRPS